MKRAILAVSAASLTLFLAGFGPPLLPSEDAQQVLPKTWIPDPKPSEPLIAAPDLPQPPMPAAIPKMTHMPAGAPCGNMSTSGVQSAPAKFVRGYTNAKQAFDEKRWADALALVEETTAFARSGQEWSGLELIRLKALMASGNNAAALALIDQLNASKECLAPIILKPMEDYRPGLLRDLGMPPG